jgi:hypothetical protein
MRKIFSFLNFLLGLFVFVSCTDDSPTAIVKDNVVSNSLDALSSSSYVLSSDNAADVFQEFKWTAPDYGFDAAITYTLQIDKAENNFANALELLTTGDLSGSLNVFEINKKLLDLGLTADEEASVEVRVKSVVNTNVAAVYSNSRQFSVTPYATSFPPIYIVGDAQSWDLAKAVKVKNTAPSVYVTTANFVNNGTFRFFATPDWSAQTWNWTFFSGGTVDANLANAADNDSNFRFVGESGTYKITVSTKDKTIVMEAVATPTLLMLGDAQGWNFSNAVELTWLGGGHFQATSDFSAGIFRFFGKSGDWGSGYGYTYFTNFVDANLENKDDGDKNFNFVGTPGSFTVDVDLDFLTVNMEAQ